jgi:hypothetical protein
VLLLLCRLHGDVLALPVEHSREVRVIVVILGNHQQRPSFHSSFVFDVVILFFIVLSLSMLFHPTLNYNLPRLASLSGCHSFIHMRFVIYFESKFMFLEGSTYPLGYLIERTGRLSVAAELLCKK